MVEKNQINSEFLGMQAIKEWAKANQSGAVISDSAHPLHSYLPEVLQKAVQSGETTVIVDLTGNLRIRNKPNEK